MLFDSIVPPVGLLPTLESMLSIPASALLSVCNILNPLLSFQQPSQHLHQEWLPSQEATLLTRKKQLFPCGREIAGIQSHLQAPLLIPVLLLCVDMRHVKRCEAQALLA